MAGTGVSFNSNSLQTTGTSYIVTSDISHHGGPTKDGNIFKLAHGNQSKGTWFGYPDKKITLRGQLISDTIANLDTLIDTFKGYLTGTDKNLDIDYAGSTRRYTATLAPGSDNPHIDRPGGLMFANFAVDFICLNPFGQNTAQSTLLTKTALTTSSSTDAITLLGSSDYQYPVISMTLNSGTGLANTSISFGNGLNGQVCTVTRSLWVAGDILAIDPFLDLVTVNGNEVAFTGAIPVWEKGSGQVTYLDTLTTRSVTYTVKHYPYWL